MTNHTPGPWNYGVLFACIIDARGGLIASLNERPDDLQTKADALLIAAAPDLLEYAKQCAAERDERPACIAHAEGRQ